MEVNAANDSEGQSRGCVTTKARKRTVLPPLRYQREFPVKITAESGLGTGSESERNGAIASLEVAEASEAALFVSCFLVSLVCPHKDSAKKIGVL